MGFEDRPVFVGRDRELATLRAALTAMRSGQSGTVLVEGPAGIGKTALVERFVASEEDVLVLRGSGEQWEALVSYGAVDQLLRSAGVSGIRLLAMRDRVLPPEEPVSVGSHLLDVLSDLEQKSPVVLIIEDVHWADTDSLRAMLFALRRLKSERVLTLLTLRDGDSGRLPEGLRRLANEPAGSTLRLEALSASEVHQLGTDLGVPELSARSATRLQAHTQGNPLFVRALLTELPAERWRTWEPMLPAPRAFAIQVQRRLEACSLATRRLVEAASALGASVPLATAAALAGVEDPLPALDEARVAELLHVRDEPGILDLVFPHPLVQAAV
jgi:predicted ATPase